MHESKCASFESRQKYPITKRWKILNLRRRPLKSSYRSSFIYVNSLLIFEVEFEVIYLDFFSQYLKLEKIISGGLNLKLFYRFDQNIKGCQM